MRSCRLVWTVMAFVTLSVYPVRHLKGKNPTAGEHHLVLSPRLDHSAQSPCRNGSETQGPRSHQEHGKEVSRRKEESNKSPEQPVVEEHRHRGPQPGDDREDNAEPEEKLTHAHAPPQVADSIGSSLKKYVINTSLMQSLSYQATGAWISLSTLTRGEPRSSAVSFAKL